MDRRARLLALLPLLAAGCATSQPEVRTSGEPAAPMRAEAVDEPMDDVATMERMMELHLRMAADTALHRRMMADTALRAAMHEAMHGEMGGMPMAGPRAGAMDPAEHARMVERMRARMEAMTPEQRRVMLDRMMAAHRRLMADPEIRARMMADPEMRRMVEEMEGMHHAPPTS